jgi:hypothetical protein
LNTTIRKRGIEAVFFTPNYASLRQQVAKLQALIEKAAQAKP